jgi:hypothetical protein
MLFLLHHLEASADPQSGHAPEFAFDRMKPYSQTVARSAKHATPELLPVRQLSASGREPFFTRPTLERKARFELRSDISMAEVDEVLYKLSESRQLR